MVRHARGAFAMVDLVPLSSEPCLDEDNPVVSTRLHTTVIDRVTIVIPTRNEQDNIEPLVEALAVACAEFVVEVIFVDDSDDGTPGRVRDVARRIDSDTFDVRLIHRSATARDGGLSGAVLHGIASASHRWVVVMDGDLQHPPSTIPDLLNVAGAGKASLISASRYVRNGSNAGLRNGVRKAVSSSCGTVSRAVFNKTLSQVTDPMTGFFLIDTEVLDRSRLRPSGFKILLEILVTHPELVTAEVPFAFGTRHHGRSKATVGQGWKYARQVASLRFDQKDHLPWRYSVHGIIQVESDERLPELDKFVTRHIDSGPSITVTVGDLSHLPFGESIDVTTDEPIVGYRERTGFAMSLQLGTLCTRVTVSRFVAKSPHVMYTNVVEPILRWRLVEIGYALVHAACFSDGANAYLVTARTDTGKTTTMLKVLNRSELSFVSDDLIIMSPDGAVRTFPKPLTISAHTVHALQNTDLGRVERLVLIPQSRVHSKQGRLFAFLLTKFRLPVASINAITQRLVPPPKYHVERLVRGVTSQRTADARGMFIIQRGGTGEEQIDNGEALQILLDNCADAFGFPPYSSLERLLLAASDEDLRTKEQGIVAAAIRGLPVMLMRSESLDWAERIPTAIRDWDSSAASRRGQPTPIET